MKTTSYHTAHFRLSFFLQSKLAAHYSLDSIDISVLNAVSYLIDSGKKNTCFAEQGKLSFIAKVDRKTVNRRLKKLCNFGIISIKKYQEDRRKRVISLCITT